MSGTWEWALPVTLRLSHAAADELASVLGDADRAGRLSDENKQTLRDLRAEVAAIEAADSAWPGSRRRSA